MFIGIHVNFGGVMSADERVLSRFDIINGDVLFTVFIPAKMYVVYIDLYTPSLVWKKDHSHALVYFCSVEMMLHLLLLHSGALL